MSNRYKMQITRKQLRRIIREALIESKFSGYHPEEFYEEGTIKNLMLDKEVKALPSTHTRVKGKDVPVNKQIINWLKSMKMVKR